MAPVTSMLGKLITLVGVILYIVELSGCNLARHQRMEPRIRNLEVLRDVVIEQLRKHRVVFTLEMNPKYQMGMEKYLSAYVIKANDNIVVILGKITIWEGLVPQSDMDLKSDGKITGYYINNMESTRSNNDDSIICMMQYGNMNNNVRNDLLAAMKRIQ